jgi:multiple sugar transport system permease protein
MFRVTGLAEPMLASSLSTLCSTCHSRSDDESFFDELSSDVEDAARIDGSSDVRVFFKVCLPQVWAGLAATAVFGLILTWNEFLFALLLSGVETRTVPVAMSQTIGGDIGVRWGLLAAIETLFLIPVIIVTFAPEPPWASRLAPSEIASDRAQGVTKHFGAFTAVKN